MWKDLWQTTASLTKLGVEAFLTVEKSERSRDFAEERNQERDPIIIHKHTEYCCLIRINLGHQQPPPNQSSTSKQQTQKPTSS